MAEWREQHPDGKVADCARDTGLSRTTVYKWWNIRKTLSEADTANLNTKAINDWEMMEKRLDELHREVEQEELERQGQKKWWNF